jgi:zinc protease
VSTAETQNEDFRKSPPPPLSPRNINLPEPEETRLDNGLSIVVVEDHRLPLVSLRLSFRSGSAIDPPSLPGLSSMMTSLLTEGTESRSSRQIAEETARIGVTLSAGGNADFTTVAASSLAQFLPETFELFADVALRPSFPPEELELAKTNTKQALIQQRAQPSFLASEQLGRVLFGSHPYAVVSPTEESIDAMTRDTLLDFHKRVFDPSNAILIAVGDVNFDELKTLAERYLGAWKGAGSTAQTFPPIPDLSERAAVVVDRPGSEQSNIVIANHGIVRTHPDFFPLYVMHTILGANASSRLFMNLREEKGYTYGAYTTLDARMLSGTFRASAEVRTSVTGASLKEFFYELDRIRTELVSEKELADAKAYLTGVFPIRLETQEGLVDQIVQMQMFGLPPDYLQNYRRDIENVTREEILRVATEHVIPATAAIVIVGDADAVVPEVREFTDKIEVYDSQGRPKTSESSKPERSGSDSLVGVWNLDLTLPMGQDAKATLTIENRDSGLGGSVESRFGDAEFESVQIDGNNVEGRLKMSLMGQKTVADFGAVVEGDQMKGSIAVTGFPSINFVGSRN